MVRSYPSGDTILTEPLRLTGAATVTGQGLGVTRLLVLDGSPAIQVSTPEPVQIQDLTIQYPNQPGQAITVSGGPFAINRESRITHIKIQHPSDGITLDAALDCVIESCHIEDFTNVGIYQKQTGYTDAGQNIVTNSVIWDLNVVGQAGIRYDQGGDLRIVNNKILGSQFGIRLVLTSGPTGTFMLIGNSIEAYTVAGFYAQQISGAFRGLLCLGNEWSSPMNVVQHHLAVVGSPPWCDQVVVMGNIFQPTQTQYGPVELSGALSSVVIGNSGL